MDNTGDPDWSAEDDNAPMIGQNGTDDKAIELTELILVRPNAEANSKTVTLLDKEAMATYVLLDMSGKVVQKGLITDYIVIQQNASGVYVIQVRQGDALDIQKIQF